MKPVAQASKNGVTMLAHPARDIDGAIFWRGTILVNVEPMTRGTWHDGLGQAFLTFEDIFGRLGYREIPAERIYYHAAHHAARLS